nr:MAG TPA: hypothetical protein [Bacteriophage sp.]
MKYLIDTTEIYRVDSEAEADQLLETAKASGVLNKYSCVYKERKQKGEIIDSWYRVTLNKKFTDEKDPTTQITISYTED